MRTASGGGGASRSRSARAVAEGEVQSLLKHRPSSQLSLQICLWTTPRPPHRVGHTLSYLGPRTLHFILLVDVHYFTALAEIIADRPKKTAAGRTNQRGRRGGRGGNRPSAKAAAVGAGAQNAAVIAASNRNKPPVVIPGRSNNAGSKIILSNLPLDVTEAQVKVRKPLISPRTLRKGPTTGAQGLVLTLMRSHPQRPIQIRCLGIL